MKKMVFSLILSAMMFICPALAENIRLIGLAGPTSMGMAYLLEQNEQGKSLNSYEFTLANAPDEVVAKISTGEADIAAVPANLASVLYNKTEGKVKIVDINTLGVLYIVELGESISSIEDLKGKTILSSGKDASPEFVLNHLLRQNNIDPEKSLSVEFKSEHNEIVAALSNGMATIALLPQPFVTAAQSKMEGLRIGLDINELWNSTNDTALTTGVTIVSKKLYDENPQAVQNFIADHKASVEYVNANVDEASQIIEKFNIFKAPIAKKALPYCNIVCVDGNEMQKTMEAYLAVLYSANPKSVGGKLPAEDFYAIFD